MALERAQPLSQHKMAMAIKMEMDDQPLLVMDLLRALLKLKDARQHLKLRPMGQHQMALPKEHLNRDNHPPQRDALKLQSELHLKVQKGKANLSHEPWVEDEDNNLKKNPKPSK